MKQPFLEVYFFGRLMTVPIYKPMIQKFFFIFQEAPKIIHKNRFLFPEKRFSFWFSGNDS